MLVPALVLLCARYHVFILVSRIPGISHQVYSIPSYITTWRLLDSAKQQLNSNNSRGGWSRRRCWQPRSTPRLGPGLQRSPVSRPATAAYIIHARGIIYTVIYWLSQSVYCVQFRPAIKNNLALRLNALLCSQTAAVLTFPISLGSRQPVHFLNVTFLIFRAFINRFIS